MIDEPKINKRYLTILEATEYLGVSRWSLYKLVQRRLVPFIPIATNVDSYNHVIGKAIIRFDIQTLDKWMAKNAIIPLNK
ncbi:MAG: helix-turn-helix domain-containing protein [Elusimicrobia bacterium]|nr:helix-turn-helix domain-containing protein [Elusimicrobiota bacterium]